MSLRARVAGALVVRMANKVTDIDLEMLRKERLKPAAPKDLVIESDTIAGIPIDRYRPASGVKREGTLLYVHGGGYIAGSVRSHRRWALGMTRRLGVETVSVDYRLAPETPFPGGQNDVEAAYTALRTSSSAPLIASGDSAGAGLIVGALQQARAQGIDGPDAVMLLWPSVDLTPQDSYRNAGRDMLNPETFPKMRELYLGEHDPSDPLCSPVNAELSWLPRTFIQIGERDLLVDDSRAMYAKLQASGVDAELHIWPGMIHAFAGIGEWLPEGRRALDQAASWAKASLI